MFLLTRYTDERMEPTTPHSGHSALDPQSSAPGAQPAQPAQPGRVLTRSASSVPRAASVQAAGVAAALSAAQVSADIESLVTEDDTPVDKRGCKMILKEPHARAA